MRMTVLEPGPLTGNALSGLQWTDVSLPPEPSLDQIKTYITPTVPRFERVAVLFQGHPADMFVDANGHALDLPRNEAATMIYRTNGVVRRLIEADPSLRGLTIEEMCRRALIVTGEEIATSQAPSIVGPAVLFEKRVWF